MTNTTNTNRPVTTKQLDALCGSVTAFDTWEKLMTAIQRDGYTPTLRHTSGRGKAAKRFNANIDALRLELTDRGMAVFPDNPAR